MRQRARDYLMKLPARMVSERMVILKNSYFQMGRACKIVVLVVSNEC
jgi:hypothetical protein